MSYTFASRESEIVFAIFSSFLPFYTNTQSTWRIMARREQENKTRQRLILGQPSVLYVLADQPT